jgi:hypothetical protein
MRLDEFQKDLSTRLGKRVSEIFTRDGEPVQDLMELYQPSPAGFAGQLNLVDGSRGNYGKKPVKCGTFNQLSSPNQ